MKTVIPILSLLMLSGVLSAQTPDPSKWMCRDLSESGGFVYQGETIFGSQACRPIPQAAPAASASVPVPKQDNGTSTPVVSAPNSTTEATPGDMPKLSYDQVHGYCATHVGANYIGADGREQSCVTLPNAPAPASSASSQGTVTFATMMENGTVQPLMPDWAVKWVKKNEKKYPGVHFQTSGDAVPGRRNFLVVFSASSRVLQGFQPVTHTQTSTSTSQVSGSGTVTSNYGDTWNYDANGTINTTTTTTVHENAGYTQNTNILYVTAYDERGTMVAQQTHVYSTQAGGDASYAAGYNFGNAIRAINARGRTLEWVIDRIEGRKQ
jgi:hypothetical protein